MGSEPVSLILFPVVDPGSFFLHHFVQLLGLLIIEELYVLRVQDQRLYFLVDVGWRHLYWLVKMIIIL